MKSADDIDVLRDEALEALRATLQALDEVEVDPTRQFTSAKT